MAKLRRVGGGNLRDIYTFFEIEALKHAFNEQMRVGQTFERGGTREKFEVIETAPGTFGVLRCKDNKKIMAAVVDDGAEPAPAIKNINGMKAKVQFKEMKSGLYMSYEPEISFKSGRGLKTALNNCIKRNIGNLRCLFGGLNRQYEATALMDGKQVARAVFSC